MLAAARATNTQVIWDLCHYGWPDDIDILSPRFVTRFAAFASAVAELVRDETEAPPLYCPINEISFWAWAGGEVGQMNPCLRGRGGELKLQLVRAFLEAAGEIRRVDPRAKLITAEPLIHVSHHGVDAEQIRAAERYTNSQFEVVDMILGRAAPELGGSSAAISAIGLNFYPHNQWYFGGSTIPLGHHEYRPLADMLGEVHRRYSCPIFIAETGAEGSARAAWLHYVGAEVRAAMQSGVPVAGLCLYPILDYPGWSNDRPCAVGLFSDADGQGTRDTCLLVADELAVQRSAIERMQGL